MLLTFSGFYELNENDSGGIRSFCGHYGHENCEIGTEVQRIHLDKTDGPYQVKYHTHRPRGTRPVCFHSSSRIVPVAARPRIARGWAREGRGGAADRSERAPCGAPTHAPASPRCARVSPPLPTRAPTLTVTFVLQLSCFV